MIEVYKGTQIAISTKQIQEKTWTSRAEYAVPGHGSVHLELAEATYATEEEARQAALQAAIESIDRRRVLKGKY